MGLKRSREAGTGAACATAAAPRRKQPREQPTGALLGPGEPYRGVTFHPRTRRYEVRSIGKALMAGWIIVPRMLCCRLPMQRLSRPTCLAFAWLCPQPLPAGPPLGGVAPALPGELRWQHAPLSRGLGGDAAKDGSFAVRCSTGAGAGLVWPAAASCCYAACAGLPFLHPCACCRATQGGFSRPEMAAVAHDLYLIRTRGLTSPSTSGASTGSGGGGSGSGGSGSGSGSGGLNFHASHYEPFLPALALVSLPELVAGLRRQSKGTVQQSSPFRGVTRWDLVSPPCCHRACLCQCPALPWRCRHMKGRWESRIGCEGGQKRYIYLGLHSTEVSHRASQPAAMPATTSARILWPILKTSQPWSARYGQSPVPHHAPHHAPRHRPPHPTPAGGGGLGLRPRLNRDERRGSTHQLLAGGICG